MSFVLKEKERASKTKSYKNSLMDLDISKNMINKISKAGINKVALLEAYKRGENGIKIMLSQTVDGKPRVTSNQKIIKKHKPDIDALDTRRITAELRTTSHAFLIFEFY